jgi:hypothetical protein
VDTSDQEESWLSLLVNSGLVTEIQYVRNEVFCRDVRVVSHNHRFHCQWSLGLLQLYTSQICVLFHPELLFKFMLLLFFMSLLVPWTLLGGHLTDFYWNWLLLGVWRVFNSFWIYLFHLCSFNNLLPRTVLVQQWWCNYSRFQRWSLSKRRTCSEISSLSSTEYWNFCQEVSATCSSEFIGRMWLWWTFLPRAHFLCIDFCHWVDSCIRSD